MGICHSGECNQQMFRANGITWMSVCEQHGFFEDLLCVRMNGEVDGRWNLGGGGMPAGCVFSDPGNREGLGEDFSQWRRRPQKAQEKVLGIEERIAHTSGFDTRYEDDTPAGDGKALEHRTLIMRALEGYGLNKMNRRRPLRAA
jgi:hypothetical protein